MRAIWLMLALAWVVRAEIVDRIAVSVGNEVITESEVAEEIRVTAFFNHEPPHFKNEDKKHAAERLIEQALIRREMDLSHYPLPLTAEADPLFQTVQKEYVTPAALQAALQKFSLTEDQVKRHLWWQLTTLRFIEERFRPSVQVPDSEVRDYYDQQVAEWRAQGRPAIPSFESARADIEKILAEQRTSRALDRWIGATRTQVDIRYHDVAFE